MAECVIWPGTKFAQGYGRCGQRKAHRVVWEQEHGPIPSGMVVMHLCNNPPCVNLEHLRLGTQAENIQQAVRERRGFVGVLNGRAKLTEDEVREIRASNLTQTALAKQYGMSQPYIGKIIHGHKRQFED